MVTYCLTNTNCARAVSYERPRTAIQGLAAPFPSGRRRFPCVIENLLFRPVLTGGSGHLPRRPLPDPNLVTVGQVDRRIEDDLVPVLHPRAKLDGRAEVARLG